MSDRKGFDYTGIAIIYFCHDGKGRFVMGLRSLQARDEHGRWDVGGGGLEFGDTVENTLRQEIKQEYSTDIVNFEFLGFRDVHREYNGRKTHWITLDFKVLIDPDQVTNGEPHKFEAVEWFTFNTLPVNLHSQLPFFFQKYKNKLT